MAYTEIIEKIEKIEREEIAKINSSPHRKEIYICDKRKIIYCGNKGYIVRERNEFVGWVLVDNSRNWVEAVWGRDFKENSYKLIPKEEIIK